MAEVKSISQMIEEASPYYQKKKAPEAMHKLIYDSSSETLEPIYFFIMDLMNDFGLAPQKLVDNFSSTPGSSHFSELGQRATIMQQQATKILGDVNTVLRSVLNIIYDLKDFRMRLKQYDGLRSKKKEEQEGALLALKQIWMDRVDIAKGNSSLRVMANSQAGFQTLIDAFLVVNDEKDADKLDLNDTVKRIVKGRIVEFAIWLAESERELKKRYELEKTYLKSQVNSLKLYSRWARPYLKAASDLEAKERPREPSLVKTFNTIILELTLLGKSKLDIADEALKGTLPRDFSKPKFLDKISRNYYSCVLVDFTFRGIPQRGPQGNYSFGGKAEVTFRAYALNDDELNKFEESMKKSELSDILNLVEGTTTESLGQLEEEINSFLEEKDESPKVVKGGDESNPFFALIGKYESPSFPSPKKPSATAETFVAPDNWTEKTHFRPMVVDAAKERAFTIFDIYKKSHGMPSYS